VMVLEGVVLTLVGIAATALVFIDDPVRQSMIASILGLFLTAAFMALQAPDVALSMLAVSAVIIPALVLLAVARVRGVVTPRSPLHTDEEEDDG
jgi:energy-converting hydrogenase B subunit D